MENQLERLTAKTFAEHVHTTFSTHLPDAQRLGLELYEVEERNALPKIELFLLHFRGPRTPRLPQQTYWLEHEKLGSFAIFLTAIGEDANGVHYEAVFNRLKKDEVIG